MTKKILMKFGFLLVIIAAGGCYFYPTLKTAFFANVPLNSLILGLWGVGVILSIRQLTCLGSEINWAIGYREGRPRIASIYYPKILAPVAAVLGNSEKTPYFSSDLLTSLAEMVRGRLEDRRQSVRYLIGVLIFLGLLGTFWGLLQTITAIGSILGDLPVNEGDPVMFFDQLKQGLRAPLSGMGVAFSSSMFGLTASLLLGFLDLQVGRSYRDFYQEIEEWLLSFERTPPLISEAEGQPVNPMYLSHVIEKLTTHLQEMRESLSKTGENYTSLSKNLVLLSDRTAAISDYMKTEQALMLKIAEYQIDLQNILKHFHNDLTNNAFGISESTQNHIRSMDVNLSQLSEQLVSQTTRSTSEICSEIRLLSRTLSSHQGESYPKIAL